MDSRSEAARRTAPKAGAATPKVSAQRAGTKPAPTEPTRTKSTRTEPAPTEPTRTKSTRTEPAPTEPTRTKSTRTKSTRTEPAPTEPAPTEPTRTKSTPTEPTRTKSTPTEPTRTKPTRTKSTRTEPAPTEPAPTEPTRTKSTRTKPTPTEPTDCPVVPEAARTTEQKCGSTRAAGPQRKKSAPGPQERPPGRARGARTQKAPPSGEDEADGQAGLVEGLELSVRRGCTVLELEISVSPELALPRAASLREGGARSAREVPGHDPPVPAPGLGRSEGAPGYWKPRAVLEKLRLKRQEISEASDTVNKVVEHLLRRMQSCQSEFSGVGLLRTGSYSEQVKISAPNEFDIMFKLGVPRIQLEEYCNSGAHYFVKFKRNPKGSPLDQFLEKDILSASKMLSRFRDIIKEEIKSIEGTDIIVERKKKGCPAVTLLIRQPKEISVDLILALEVKSSWPPNTQEGLPIHNWLGRKVRRGLRQKPYYLVPKPAKEGNSFIEETWRLSFSHVEKEILKNHGQSKTCCEADGVKCCRKDCLKLMKYLLEQLKKKFEDQKKMAKFCSYHVKTAFLHTCTDYPHDNEWQVEDLGLCFDRCVRHFLRCLETEHLDNYFIPGVNLFSRDQIDKTSKEFLSNKIEYERNNGFPVFSEF
ncbi:cyclic GMP-AMP synthase [Saccopteryx leptura]|uniref:cyclic GMP-AMP synthase n=1 Tax=Saccopteryx leptura TaxID=249018 RepID=UPI00339C7090